MQYIDLGACCDDCYIAIANDDYSGISDERKNVVARAIWSYHAFDKHLIVGDDLGFSWQWCDICDGLAGNRHAVGYFAPKIKEDE